MAMRMERIFRDYETQLAAQSQRAVGQEAQDVRRVEYGKLLFSDRLAGQLGRTLRVSTGDSLQWEGSLESVGRGWIQLQSFSENILIPQNSINWWEGGTVFSSVDARSVARSLSLGYAFRALAAARIPVRIFHQFGSSTTEGTVERVGLDFLEIALHPLEGHYRSQEIRGWRSIQLSNISACCSLTV